MARRNRNAGESGGVRHGAAPIEASGSPVLPGTCTSRAINCPAGPDLRAPLAALCHVIRNAGQNEAGQASHGPTCPDWRI